MWTPLLVLLAISGFALILAALVVVGRRAHRSLNRVCSCGWSLKAREVTTSGGLSIIEMYCPMCCMLQAGREAGVDRAEG